MRPLRKLPVREALQPALRYQGISSGSLILKELAVLVQEVESKGYLLPLLLLSRILPHEAHRAPISSASLHALERLSPFQGYQGRVWRSPLPVQRQVEVLRSQAPGCQEPQRHRGISSLAGELLVRLHRFPLPVPRYLKQAEILLPRAPRLPKQVRAQENPWGEG